MTDWLFNSVLNLTHSLNSLTRLRPSTLSNVTLYYRSFIQKSVFSLRSCLPASYSSPIRYVTSPPLQSLFTNPPACPEYNAHILSFFYWNKSHNFVLVKKGIDDVLALLLAFAAGEEEGIEVLMVSVTFGNADVQRQISNPFLSA